jgi:site-specific DNA-methyltransferase (adenine-specific)
VKEDDFDPDAHYETKVKAGEVWQLGEHRLMCGDSTDADAVAKLMNGERADLVFTDPPYKIESGGGGESDIAKSLTVQKSDIDFISGFDPTEFLKILPTVFDKNMYAYVFCNKDLLPQYLNWAVENGYGFNVLIWKKPSAIPIKDAHRPDIEYLLFFRKKAIWNHSLEGVNYSRCLEYSRVQRSEENGNHPTPKPIALIGNELQISSDKGSVILDLFGGSGSTLIACEQLHRKCRMMELDPHYCTVIIARWEKLTGLKAVKLNE